MTDRQSIFATLLLVAFALITSCSWVAAAEAVPAKFDPFSETQEQYDARAQWLRDAKFGVFIHWNPSSLIGKEISWSRGGYGAAKYDELYKQFKGERFNADEWVQLFHEAGVRYAVCVPKHHDGFCMFDTKTSPYNVMNTPFGRDYIKEISAACGKSDVRFCLYYSVTDWWNPAYSNKSGADLTEYIKIFKTHMTELMTHYGPVGYIWFDGHWDSSWTHAYGREMYGFIRSLQPNTLMGNRIEPKPSKDGPNCTWTGSFYDAPDAVGDFQAREMDLGKYYPDKAWDSCYNISSGGWAWTPPTRLRPMNDILNWMIQCAGRDGSMLLGIGPRPDGTIEPAQASALLEVGDWLKLNGEAVYGTRGGPYLPQYWGVSTRKADKIYLFVTKWAGVTLKLPTPGATVKSARLITRGEVTFQQDAETLTVRVPDAFQRSVATIVELTLDGSAMNLPTIAGPANLSLGKPVEVSSVWTGRKELAPANITDGIDGSLWAAEEKAREGWVVVDLQEPRAVASALVSDSPYGRTREFDIEADVDGKWTKIASGHSIGNELMLGFTPVTARRFRLNIRKAADTPTVAEFQLFAVPDEKRK